MTIQSILSENGLYLWLSLFQLQYFIWNNKIKPKQQSTTDYSHLSIMSTYTCTNYTFHIATLHAPFYKLIGLMMSLWWCWMKNVKTFTWDCLFYWRCDNWETRLAKFIKFSTSVTLEYRVWRDKPGVLFGCQDRQRYWTTCIILYWMSKQLFITTYSTPNMAFTSMV